MIRRPPRSTLDRASAASDVYKRQALFNILQEGDVQIRGFKLRLPLDIQFVFTANPEDYTNRGAIITPLKDRIPVSYTHLRAHETVLDLVCRLLLEKNK